MALRSGPAATPPSPHSVEEVFADATMTRAERRRRLYNVITALSGLFAALLYLATTNEYLNMSLRQIFIRSVVNALPLVALVFLFISLSVGVVQYLQGGFRGRSVVLAAAPSQAFVTPQPHPDVPELLRGETVTELPSPKSSVTEEDIHFSDITRYADEMMGRLSKAVEEQGRRNNINLGFGFFVTLVGVSALLFFVRDYKDIDPSKPLAILNFLPRLSLVILIELFAYFFLNLYKNGLVEVKYLQNELVNVRMRTLGLRTAIRESDKESAAHIMKAFGDTDRNSLSSRLPSSKSTSEDVLKTVQQALKLAGKVASGKGE